MNYKIPSIWQYLSLVIALGFYQCSSSKSEIKDVLEPQDEMSQFQKKYEFLQDSFLNIPTFGTLTYNEVDNQRFRLTKFAPFNGPVEIVDIGNNLLYARYAFDFDCHFLGGDKRLTGDCFELLDSFYSEVTMETIDSIFKLLEYVEFWNLSTIDLSDSGVIFDGEYIVIEVWRSKRDQYGNIVDNRHRIQRDSPDRFLGTNYLSEEIFELVGDRKPPDNKR